ncbi:hypothetical protein EZS27_019546 [termite gut metagenome]|uniref:DUF1573 domain-containing protein n=1 Tax=termite gut metagenome TaxID=433724 RepID=A0A5J4RCT8_9ZZZZ
MFKENSSFVNYSLKKRKDMKKTILFSIIALIIGCNKLSAQNEAEIKFDTLIHNFGTFSEKTPVVSYEFRFTNTGKSLLIIHQAVASCGCTVAEFNKKPIATGGTGTIKVTYNGTGKLPGYFKKSVTLRTNSKTEMIRLYIEGTMEAKK